MLCALFGAAGQFTLGVFQLWHKRRSASRTKCSLLMAADMCPGNVDCIGVPRSLLDIGAVFSESVLAGSDVYLVAM